MLRLRRYLKPYTLMLAATIILLFAQANFDLALPDYLARIVNTGIQQGGIDSPVPQAMRQETLQRLVLFMSAEDEAAVRAAYTLVEPGSTVAEEYADTYPLVAREAIYVRNDLTQEEIDRISKPVAQSLTIVAALQQAMADPQSAQMLGGAQGGFDLSRIPPGTDIFAVLGQLPPAQRTQIADMADERFAALGDSFVSQAAIRQVRAEYEALGADVSALQTRYISSTGAIMLLITLLSVTSSVSVGLLSARVAAGVSRDLRSDVFKKVESFSSAEFDKFPTASLITRCTNDITQMQMLTMITMRLVFYAPIMGVGGIIRAIDRGPSMWWTIALAVIVLLSIIVTLIIIVVPKFRIMQKLIDRLNLVARENLSGILVIRAFNMQPFEEERFDKANVDLAETTLFIARTMAVMMPVMMLILNVLSVTILWVGAHQVAEANMQVGDMMAFLQYAMQIVFSFLMMSMLFIILPRASVSAERVADVLETEPEITDPAEPLPLNGDFRGE
ncbi:MAG TPA: ABC transporter permease, partial [Candidatus Binatia bacterium]|nr:ABC transporter permease [Candidatus Binatia bacterium]